MTVEWPSVLVARNSPPNLRNVAASGGRTGAGGEQRVVRDPGYWVFPYTFAVRSRDQVLAWNALVDALKSGEAVVAPVFIAHIAKGAEGPHSATVAAPVAHRAVTLTLTTTGLTLDEKGVGLSVGERFYRISEITGHTPGGPATWSDAGAWSDEAVWRDTAPDSYTMKVRPTVREPITAGTAVEFRDPKCLCEINQMNDGDLDLDLGFSGDPTLTLREAI